MIYIKINVKPMIFYNKISETIKYTMFFLYPILGIFILKYIIRYVVYDL